MRIKLLDEGSICEDFCLKPTTLFVFMTINLKPLGASIGNRNDNQSIPILEHWLGFLHKVVRVAV
ncbi:hypothetical protein GCM10028807_26200 [Spirosoma daeguense]